MLESKSIVRAGEFHDLDSAIAVNESHLNALWASSLTMSVANGFLDDEVSFKFEKRLAIIKDVAAVNNCKPIIFDGDSGLSVEHFVYMVKALEDSGVEMVIIEDKTGKKENSLHDTVKAQQDDPDRFAEKIRHGIKARRSGSFLIGARIESFCLGKGIDNAVTRAGIYLNAGSDAILIHSKHSTPNEVLEFSRRYSGIFGKTSLYKPLIAIPSTYHTITGRELERNGFSMVIYANHAFRGELNGIPYSEVWKAVREHDRTTEIEERLAPIRQVMNMYK